MTGASSLFASLPAQVAGTLREQIRDHTWNEWLPSERALAESLQVSRKTLRKALSQLQREGVVEAVRGLGNRIISDGIDNPGKPVDSVVVLLTPDPVERMRPYTSLWTGHLRSLLIEHGFRLRMVHSPKYFSRRPSISLKKLTTSQPAACWLLANSSEATQRWFSEAELPCVVAGSCHPGIDLPNVDLDHYALCRHAAGILLGAGHRSIAMLNAQSDRAGDLESEAGFMAGVSESPHADASPLVIHHEDSPDSLCRALKRLLRMAQMPTAILVSNGASYLTIISSLAQYKLSIPKDVSVVSRDDEPFLRFLVPRPTYYAANPHTFAKQLLKPILKLLTGDTPMPRSTRIIPTYVKGGSLEIRKTI